MLTAKEANELYNLFKRKDCEVRDQVDKVLLMIESTSYNGLNFVKYHPQKRMSKDALDIIYKLGYSILGYEGINNRRFEYIFFWRDDCLNNVKYVVKEYDDSVYCSEE